MRFTAGCRYTIVRIDSKMLQPFWHSTLRVALSNIGRESVTLNCETASVDIK
jgi:hypothetical protein